jgi:rfaE bifunctional protein nucleotidyltransferase chain/domain
MKTVFTNGCFDLLHVGHIRLLQAAKALGDSLVVGLNSDVSFHLCKGRRPLFPEDIRQEMLLALKSVDQVVIFDHATPIGLIRGLQPDVLVKGNDYQPEDVVGSEYADETVCISVDFELHTSDILERIVEMKAAMND